jgi:hypothetical protein
MITTNSRKTPGLSATAPEAPRVPRVTSRPVDLSRTWFGAEISPDADALFWLEQAPFGDLDAQNTSNTPTDLTAWVGYYATPDTAGVTT